MTKLEATAKVQRLRISFTDEEVVKKIGISKPTLYTRISNHNWKVSEIFLIEKLK
jgi:predicted DNA-binding transcriptional regulator AlpA